MSGRAPQRREQGDRAGRARRRLGVLARSCGALLVAVVAHAIAQDAEAPAATATDASTPADSPTAIDPARAQEEAAVRERLAAIREQQRVLTAEREATRGERAGLMTALREDELRVAATARALRGFDEALAARESDLAKLHQDEAAAQARLAKQRDAIAALLRSAYALGRHDQLRLLFAPEQVRDVARLMAYHRYLERDRRERIAAITRDLAAVAAVRASLQQAQDALAAARRSQENEATQLETARAERQASLAALEARLADQAERLAALGKDERELLALIDRLRDAIADVPREIAGAEPFASLRGRVPWPVAGKVLQRFGAAGSDGRPASGILLGAAAGTNVKAVSHGRVAYADWLTGYGLIVIVDHGDGYLTLYAHNETLLKDVGDWVDKGEAIATVGSSGGRHETGVWFEVRERSRPLDPTAWLSRTN